MRYERARSSESLIFSRIMKNKDDPGTQLTYRFRLTGKIVASDLEQALCAVLQRSYPDILSHFSLKEGILYKESTFSIPDILLDYIDNSACSGLAGENKRIVLDLQGEHLFRFLLVRIGDDLHELQLTFSHLIFDGECYSIFAKHLSAAYEQIVAGGMMQAIPAYADSAAEVCFHESSESAVIFWKDWLSRHKLGQPVPFVKRRKTSYQRFITVRRVVSGHAYHDLIHFLMSVNSTLFRCMAAALVVTLSKYDSDSSEDITIAYTVSTRTAKEQLGCFVNVLPLSIPVQSSLSPRQYVGLVAAERELMRPHQFMPSQQIIALASEKVNRNSPLFNVVLNQSPGLFPIELLKLSGLSTEFIEAPATGGPFDLGVNFCNEADSLYLSVDVPEELASYQLVAKFADNLLKTLSFFIESPDEAVSALDLHCEFRPVACGPVQALEQVESVPDCILSQAAKTPDKIAVRYRDVGLSYAQLAAKSLALAAKIASSVNESDLEQGVGLLLGRSELLPVAMLAALVLKVPFVPLEPSLPPDRLNQILTTTSLAVIISDAGTSAGELAEHHPRIKTIVLSPELAQADGKTDEFQQASIGRREQAYILFTSGSTGVPKGIVITRRNLLNFMLSMEDRPGATASDHFLALTPISFDISILELLFPLFVGASLEVLDDEFRFSAAALGERINASGATVVQATPSTWRLLKNSGWSRTRPLKILCGGEPLESELAGYLLEQGYTVYNMYGPTETTIWSSCARLSSATDIYLGTPVFNTRYYILDDSLKTVPDGIAGELVIEGECTAQGYLNYESSKSFITINGLPGIFYRTGDLVRSYGDGQIAYIGRRDNQRKINGYRIELDEVSSQIKRLAGNIDVITVARQKPEPHLCSFYYSNLNERIEESLILAALGRVLPAYMIPSSLVRLREIPLTVNGKIDVKRLESAPLDLLEASFIGTGKALTSQQNHKDEPADLTSLRRLVHETLDLDIPDADTPLGWLGLNSISYNLLSQAMEMKMGVRMPPHRFYELNTLSAISRELWGLRSATVADRKNLASPAFSSAKVGDSRIAQPIAIVGYSVIMPNGLDADSLWAALLRRENLISSKFRSGFNSIFKAGFLPDIEGFDARFFSISPLEANHMDPRQRLLLQTTWHALEDAGYSFDDLKKSRVGCYIAATGADYAVLQARARAAFTPYSLSGSSLSILANRISSFFDWKGPSFTLDTACSGSLSAVVKACHDLSAGVCETALVGAANIIADEQVSLGLEAGNFLSPRFRCAAFDESADGYVRGEGVACFLLKPLNAAIKNGDAIRGVIHAYRENHGGRASSLTAPSVEGQTALLTETYSPELASKVSYIETHGTGTRLGDPIEIDALKMAWKELCPRTTAPVVWLGAIKTNIGHLEAAAGAASLAKVLLALEYKTLPPNHCFTKLNSYISLDGCPFRILTETQPWNQDEDSLAGISSFGFGGSNGHIVVGAPPARSSPAPSKSCYLLTMSARSETSLLHMKEFLRVFLEEKVAQGADLNIENVAYTLNACRSHFEHRMAWVAAGLADFAEQLAKPFTASHIRTSSQPESPSFRVGARSRAEHLQVLKEQYLQGRPVDWRELHQGEACLRVHLPVYQFDAKPFWFDRKRSDHPMAVPISAVRNDYAER
ncbi:MAG TPA: AMP-binding protein [Candidatus Angelobacter sp.]|nr:AMP-binding protein [Candidatus Angelobacter sp.]